MTNAINYVRRALATFEELQGSSHIDTVNVRAALDRLTRQVMQDDGEGRINRIHKPLLVSIDQFHVLAPNSSMCTEQRRDTSWWF